ncbi:pectin lyase fold/virulence factor [Syncephalastrum racemosum]|uniref:Pectin lyase fold/virulence factor n=1 Tax=Syncephalastrum racemosum TaxID=13706 RepID=A0A1X2HFL6_SYNRA|nr:pectin lyase fold/virulence factor [Syncephalastrum racemosum]
MLSKSFLAIVLATASAAIVQGAAIKTCTVKSSGGDDASAIETAFKNCNKGGIVKFTKGTTYNLKSVVSIEKVQDITVDFQGTINLPSYNTKFEKEKAFFYIAGDNIQWTGGGTFNGNGQGWYDAVNRNAPPLFKPKATNSQFSGFTIKQAPRSHFSINGCDNVLFDSLTLHTVSTNSKKDAHNTDAFDVSGSQNIVIQHSTITNGDDCIAVNNGVKNLTVTHLDCTGSHGFSVGSLGKNGNKETETVSDLKFISNACHNCQNGVRIKTWPGGKGTVKDIKFEDINLDNVDNPIIITTHYCDNQKMSYCKGNDDSSLSISDVTLSNIYGTASNHAYPILSVNCSKNTPCSGFSISDINVTPAKKTTANECINLKNSNKISYCSK